MIVRDVRNHIETARKLIDEGDADEAQKHLSIAARQLDPSTMLTTTEAADLLGIRSKNRSRQWRAVGRSPLQSWAIVT